MSKRLPTNTPSFAVAACSMSLVSGNEMQLFPAGRFRARDGRPAEVTEGWYIDGAIAANLIAAANQRATDYVIDYDHQTLRARQNGQPAPAAGWFKQLEWREGVGLFAIAPGWTPPAAAGIEQKEYRYCSPVFTYDKITGHVTGLWMAAITNDPAIDGMDEVLLAAASAYFDTPTNPTSDQENEMEELLERLIWLLNLPVGSTADDCIAQLNKLIDQLKTDDTVTAAASFDLNAYLVKLRQGAAALSTDAPDPAKFVPFEAMQALQGQVAALSSQVASLKTDSNTGRVEAMVKDAVDSGKLLPALAGWAQDLGNKDFAALSTFLEGAPAIPALAGTQTNGLPPAGAKTGVAALSTQTRQLCAAFGVAEDDYKKTLAAELAQEPN